MVEDYGQKIRSLFIFMLGATVWSGAGTSFLTASESPAAAPREPRPVRAYKHPYNDGLYSTITTLLTIGAPKIEKQKTFKLKPKGFKKEIEVNAVIQEQKAPLVFVLVGADGKADTPMGRLYPYWLEMSGVNALFFDSPFRPQFTIASRQGVIGNMEADCLQVASIVQEFLEQKEIKGKVSKIGVLGYSLGGMQAMVMARMAADKKLPFELSGALAFSPPIKMKTTARLMDTFYDQDRWKYKLIDMGKVFMAHDPVKEGEAIPFEPSFMRAGIGYLVREEFTDIVEKTDKTYRLRHIPDEVDNADVNRIEEARAWGFTRFVEKMSFPYWKNQKNNTIATVEEMWDQADLTKIMTNLPPYAHAIICENDPLNEPADLEVLKKTIDNKHLTIEKIGGHMGYVGSGWDYDQMMRMFLDR